MRYEPRHYGIRELVPRSVFDRFGGDQNIWLIFDGKTLRVADLVRDRYGKMLANTWPFGGEYEFRGFRPWGCGVGAELSQHKLGRAIDLDPQEATPEEIRRDILSGNAPDIAGLITCLEMDISWLHMDRGNREADPETGIQLVYP